MDILKTEIKPPRKTEILAIRLETTVLERLERLAKQRGMKSSGAARVLITHYVDEMLPMARKRA